MTNRKYKATRQRRDDEAVKELLLSLLEKAGSKGLTPEEATKAIDSYFFQRNKTNELHVDCWCYTIKKQVYVRGDIVGRRQAELLDIKDCDEKSCTMRNTQHCLIGKIREGRWP